MMVDPIRSFGGRRAALSKKLNKAGLRPASKEILRTEAGLSKRSFVKEVKGKKYLFTQSHKGMVGKHYIAAALKNTNNDFQAMLKGSD